jgi:hypothetical protein
MGCGACPATTWPNLIRTISRDRNHSFESLAAYNVTQGALDTGNDPSRAWVDEASGNYFDALGLKPYLGRFFHGSDEHGPNSAPFIVLTYDFWHSHFQGDPSVIGRVVRLNKFPYTIIGVGPPEFHGTLMFFNPDFFVPMVNHAQFDENDLNARGDRWVFMTLGHLKTGVTPAQAIADLNSVGAALEKAYPKDDPKMSFKLARPGLYGDYIGRPVRTFMTALRPRAPTSAACLQHALRIDRVRLPCGWRLGRAANGFCVASLPKLY